MKLRLLLFALFFVSMYPVANFAQSGQQGDGSLLPEINPQDIEIRSEFKARFPGLRRQPILGFNPKPRVYQIDPNRMPFLETREEAVADISVTELGRPTPPFRTLLHTPERQNAYLRGGIGSYLSPEIYGYGFYKLNDSDLLSANLNLQASDGHLDNQESSFRYFDANARYISKRSDDLKLIVDVGGLSDQNYLFNLEDNYQQNIIGKTADKSYGGFNAQVTLQNMKNTLTGWEASAGGNLFSATLNAGSAPMAGKISENQLQAAFSYFWPGKRLYETFDVSAKLVHGSFNPAAFSSKTRTSAEASFKYERLFNFSTRISGKGGITYVSDPMNDQVYFTPEVEVKHNFSDKLSLTGTAFAKPDFLTVQEHHQHNRFLNADTQLRHAYHMGANGTVNIQLIEGNKVFGGVSYSHINDYAYYERDLIPPPTSAPGFYSVRYSDADIFEIYGGVSQQLLPEKFWFSGKVYARSPQFSTGGVIPYEEKLGVEGAISYKIIKELTINSWAEYIGKRKAPQAGSDLKGFLLLNAGAEYQINDTFGVYAKLLNIMGQNYQIWDGYQERPFQMFGGVTVKF